MSATGTYSDDTALEAELLRTVEHIGRRFRRAALASSLSAEDMVLTHAIAAVGAPIDVFVIDTGRLHAETLALLEGARRHYDLDLLVYRPREAAVDDYVARHGLNGFYQSVELRHRCCHIRKVEPLEAALKGRDAWLTGQRRAHGPERAALAVEEHDAARNMAKLNPLAPWSDSDLWQFIRRHDVPVNPLHALGYPSIGCEPCTRAIKPGEPLRAGRWWWEADGAKKECGLHVAPPSGPARPDDSRNM
jgi:phosphoadenosine phosphosulfate reductase